MPPGDPPSPTGGTPPTGGPSSPFPPGVPDPSYPTGPVDPPPPAPTYPPTDPPTEPPPPPQDPVIQIDINDTPTNTDDITLVDPVQTIKAKITNTGGPGTITLKIPNGFSTVSPSTLTLAAGQSKEVTLTPSKVSQAVDDVIINALYTGAGGEKVVGTQDMTNVSVTLPEAVRNADTPKDVPDRIPPRVGTPLDITITPDLGKSGQVVTLLVPTANSTNGSVKFDQAAGGTAATIDLTSSGGINIRGDVQTSVGRTPGAFAGRLKLTARVHGENTAKATPGFSVAAIPVNWSQSFDRLYVEANRRGIVTKIVWESDSGVLGDLSQVKITESLRTTVRTGTFVGETFAQSAYSPASPGISPDFHFQTIDRIDRVASELDYDQLDLFKDWRTGATDIPVANSGYKIVQKTKLINGAWTMRTTKVGAQATVVRGGKSFTSEAGKVVGEIDSGDQPR